ncbi:MAG TPA: hypothetical protein VHX63_13340 [Acidobacteriaceae bacterium]|jgi:hypothetical protein|nr:hypothetical protein [Acidobacteriaceae bacterium]
MQPSDLKEQNFDHYPPEARALAVENLATLRRVPFALLPVLLCEVIDYDWRFPAEQRALDRQFAYLRELSPSSFAALMAPFAGILLPPKFAATDWVNQPQRFSERLSTDLWSTLQIDAYRKAATQYQNRLQAATPEKAPAVPRFAIVVVGQGVAQTSLPLFRPLRPHGTLFTSVQPEHGLDRLVQFMNQRAADHPLAYSHWYIDGGIPIADCGSRQGITLTSYSALAAAALEELNLTNKFVEQAAQRNAANAETVQSFIAALGLEDLGLERNVSDRVLRHFEVKVLTEGAGTQVFSTTFVQWSAREALRRAQPLTLLTRYAPRQRMAPMDELLKRNPLQQATDAEGSLIDADMGAYYTWINQSRLPGSEDARFLVWYEGHSVALAIAPSMARAATSDEHADMDKILGWMT